MKRGLSFTTDIEIENFKTNIKGTRCLIIHPGGVVTQPFTILEEHPTVTTGESLFPDEFTTDHFVTGSSLGPTALVFTDTTSDIHT